MTNVIYTDAGRSRRSSGPLQYERATNNSIHFKTANGNPLVITGKVIDYLGDGAGVSES